MPNIETYVDTVHSVLDAWVKANQDGPWADAEVENYYQILFNLDEIERINASLPDEQQRLQERLRDHEDPLVEANIGEWGAWEGHKPMRLSELRRMRQGICSLFSIEYKNEWIAEEYQILGTSRQQLQERAERLRTAFPGLSQKYQGEV
jgi:hypothetical protein